MSRLTAVICEFNPLHSGHEALLRHVVSQDSTVLCIMSGNFTQRSECAVYDKYKRAEAALKVGADIVLELPFPWCSGGAEFFAYGAVSIGEAVGADKYIFGSESGSTEYVMRAAEVSSCENFKKLLKDAEENEIGAAVSYDRAMRQFGIELNSNDKLAAEYIKAAKRIGSAAEFEAFKRMCDPQVYRSATELRRMIYEGRTEAAEAFLARGTRSIYPDESDVLEHRLCEIEHMYLRLFANDGEDIFDAGGGVFERLKKSAMASADPRDLFKIAATKKYTDSRLRRAALYTLLGVTEEMIGRAPEVTLLLGASRRGRAYLSEIRKSAGIAVLTKPSDDSGFSDTAGAQLETIRRADELYSMCLRAGVLSGEFIRRRPCIE